MKSKLSVGSEEETEEPVDCGESATAETLFTAVTGVAFPLAAGGFGGLSVWSVGVELLLNAISLREGRVPIGAIDEGRRREGIDKDSMLADSMKEEGVKLFEADSNNENPADFEEERNEEERLESPPDGKLAAPTVL